MRIEPIVVPFNHTHTITGKDFRTYKTPVVYAWKRGNEWLYVGSSHRGLQRVVDSKHHALHQAEMHDTDEILMMYQLTPQQARTLEVYLIRTHKPRYNRIVQ
jgi:excinuclease UvrABC nuclease subunit